MPVEGLSLVHPRPKLCCNSFRWWLLQPLITRARQKCNRTWVAFALPAANLDLTWPRRENPTLRDAHALPSYRLRLCYAVAWSEEIELCADALCLRLVGQQPDEVFPRLRAVQADA